MASTQRQKFEMSRCSNKESREPFHTTTNTGGCNTNNNWLTVLVVLKEWPAAVSRASELYDKNIKTRISIPQSVKCVYHRRPKLGNKAVNAHCITDRNFVHKKLKAYHTPQPSWSVRPAQRTLSGATTVDSFL